MKKPSRRRSFDPDMPAEIDFSKGVRGKYVGLVGPDTPIVITGVLRKRKRAAKVTRVPKRKRA